MKTQCEVEIYEIDGEDIIMLNPPKILIESHWNCKNSRVVVIVDGKKYTIVANHLKRAIENCVNTA